MRCRNRLLCVLLMAALMLGMVQPVRAQNDATEPSPALQPPQPRPDAPTYGTRGPYAVGVLDFVIDTPERRIPVTVWYPALNPDGAEEFVAYPMDFLPNPAAGFTTGGRALRDAEPDLTGGPYPIVLYSHGAWCFPAIAGFFTEHLASYGFVVMAPVHEDNWGTLFESTWRSEVSRPQDMKRVLDFAEESTTPGGELAGLIDMEHVAVTGQSFGGATALEMGGARLNLAEWQETFCADFPDDEDCKAYPAHFEEMAALAGLDAVPEELWPDWSDPRVDVVLTTAPGVSMLGGGGLEAMNRPFMLLMGTSDIWVGPAHEYRQFYATLAGPNKTRVLYENADHMIFGNACESYPGMVDAGFYMICSDQVWDMDRAHDLTNHFATAFLLAELKGDAEAAAALAPENVSFPGIQYEATGYGESADAPIEPENGYADVNGTHLYFEMAGEGEPVVLIHGLGWDTRDWNYQFAELAKNYQVVRYDMRGFGKSDMPTDQPYAHADDLKALLEFLGIESAHVFGHSFGGEIAINFALAYPEIARSLVLIEPDIQGAQGLPALTPKEEASFAAVFAALEKEDNAGAALAIVDMHPLVAVAKDVPDARELILSAFTDYQWFQFLNEDPVVQPEIASAGRIEEITVPTLLVVGDSTTEYQKIEVDRLVEGLPDAEKVVFENSDHFPHVLYPDKFNTLVLDFMAGVGAEAESQSTQLDVDFVTQIDALVEETMARIDLPGFALAVVKDGEVVYTKGFGTTSLAGGAPVTEQTIFQWCETSMALTTMAVLQLAEEGKLDLDAPIVDYVPYFRLADERYTEITTGQILAQVAGIPDSGAAMADWENFMPQYDAAALDRWVRNDLAEKGLLFAPGEGWEYSDLAYSLLGAVVEAASGQPYEAYMTEHFLAPLGMDKSTFLLEAVDKTLLASPHVPDATGAIAVTKAQPYHRPFAAANNLFANVADMAKLAQFSLNRGELNGVRLLPESAFDRMWTATTPTPFADFPFGRIHPSMLMLEWGNGWFLGDIAGHPAPNTGGGEHGYLAQMFLVPDANLGVVAVGNRLATDEYYAADIAADILGMLLEK